MPEVNRALGSVAAARRLRERTESLLATLGP
jgi:hypothetical protein